MGIIERRIYFKHKRSNFAKNFRYLPRVESSKYILRACRLHLIHWSVFVIILVIILGSALIKRFPRWRGGIFCGDRLEFVEVIENFRSGKLSISHIIQYRFYVWWVSGVLSNVDQPIEALRSNGAKKVIISHWFSFKGEWDVESKI